MFTPIDRNTFPSGVTNHHCPSMFLTWKKPLACPFNFSQPPYLSNPSSPNEDDVIKNKKTGSSKTAVFHLAPTTFLRPYVSNSLHIRFPLFFKFTAHSLFIARLHISILPFAI